LPAAIIPIANPLFLPLAFLSPYDEHQCLFCELRLVDFALINAGMTNKAKGKETVRLGATELRGGSSSEKQTRYQVEFDDSSRVTKIRWIADDGSKLSEMELHDYRVVTGASFTSPRAIQLARSLDLAKEPWITLRYVIDELEFDQPIADSVFSIPRETMDTVVDSSNRFLKFRGTDRKDFCAFLPG
jgi:hypothetical protein